MMKMLEHRLIEKDGQTVQKQCIISLEFIVALVTSLAILTNIDAVKWLQVKNLPVEYILSVCIVP